MARLQGSCLLTATVCSGADTGGSMAEPDKGCWLLGRACADKGRSGAAVVTGSGCLLLPTSAAMPNDNGTTHGVASSVCETMLGNAEPSGGDVLAGAYEVGPSSAATVLEHIACDIRYSIQGTSHTRKQAYCTMTAPG